MKKLIRHTSPLFISLLFFFNILIAQDSYRDSYLQPEKIMDVIGVKAGMVIGEVGAGEGYFTFKLSRRVGETGKIYANDISTSALKKLEQRMNDEKVTNIIPIHSQETDSCFPKDSLYMVIMVYVFHDLSRPVDLMKNIKPTLKPNARVVIVDRDPERYTHDASHFMKKSDVINNVEKAGYKVEKIETFLVSDNIYILVPEKISSLI